MQFLNAHNVAYEPSRFLSFDDVLLVPKKSHLQSRNDPSISLRTKFTQQTQINCPILSANMDTVTGPEMVEAMAKFGAFGILHRFFPTEEQYLEAISKVAAKFGVVAFSIGSRKEDVSFVDKVLKTVKANQYIVCIDVAHAHLTKIITQIKGLRSIFGANIQIIAGNICTAHAAQDLIIAGVDAIKVGVGCGCFTSSTKVLMANGLYKNINTIIPGEYVINRDGQPVKVNKVINNGFKKVIKIQTTGWHEDIYVTPNHQYWIGDCSTINNISDIGKAKVLDKLNKRDESKYKWCEINNLNDKMFLLRPKNITWTLPENIYIDLANFTIKGQICDDCIITTGSTTGQETIISRKIESSYDLGYIFGLFLGDGHCSLVEYNGSTRGSIKFYFHISEIDIANKCVNSLNKLFGNDLSVTTQTLENKNLITVHVYSKILANLFVEFNKKNNKRLPSQYYCTNLNYIQGLYDGLVDSDGSIEKNGRITLTNTSSHLIELFNFCCLNLKCTFTNSKREKTIGNLECNPDNLKQPYCSRTHTTNRFTKNYEYQILLDKTEEIIEQETWDIEVDCPTHSFIANNSIVHNSFCSTRIVTGCGMPQLTAIMHCRRAINAMQSNVALIADGGIRNSGDIVKALAAGANSVMIGKLFAGTTESLGQVYEYIPDKNKYVLHDGLLTENQLYKKYRGQSSRDFMNDLGKEGVSAEGVSDFVPYKGSVENIIKELIGGIRSSMTYNGVDSLEALSEYATFIEITANGLIESMPHGVKSFVQV